MIKNLIILIVVVGVGIFAATQFMGGSEENNDDITLSTVRKGELIIDVIEGGNVEARDKVTIRNEVSGGTTIISMVPEGTILTQEDVDNKKVIIKLDSDKLENSEGQQSINVESAKSAVADAEESLQIQVKTNESNIKKAELARKFALLDLQKQTGEQIALDLVENKLLIKDVIKREDLGGQLLQQKRDLQSKIDLQEEDLTRARSRYEGTKKLAEKGYVTQDDLTADKLALKREEVALEQSELNLELFLDYDFIKETEKLLSDYQEAVLEVQRTEVKNKSNFTKATVKFETAQKKYKEHNDQLLKLREQMTKCEIVAPCVGLVVYEKVGRRETIQVGDSIRERQEIINIPRMDRMNFVANIHESVVGLIKPGMRTEITIDALPNQIVSGEVTNVGVLPESQGWLNPNLKVYKTIVSIESTDLDLKPGMSGQVRIIASELEDVTIIPIQSVFTRDKKQFVQVYKNNEIEIREVKTGLFNDDFIHITSGLSEDEEVIMQHPDYSEWEEETEEKKATKKSKKLDTTKKPEDGEKKAAKADAKGKQQDS